MDPREELEALRRLAELEARAGEGVVEERTPPRDEGSLDMRLQEAREGSPIEAILDMVNPGAGLGAAGGALLTRLGRLGGAALRGGRWATSNMDAAVKSGEMIPADKIAEAVQTATSRGALGGAKLRAAEEALTGPGARVGQGGRLELPIDQMDLLRRIGNKLRGANAGEGKMLTKAAKSGLEEAGTPGAEQLLQALSDIAVRKRLTPNLSPWGLLTGQPARGLWRANQALRPNRLLELGGAGLGAALGGYAGRD